jgi:DNA glycosylase AlkZ-like
MNETKLRAWWSHRQGLDGSLKSKKPAEVLEHAGWARSVGGVGPYLTLFARAGTSRETADASVGKLDIHELPAARGCTYVLPSSHYALGLTLAEAFGDAEMKVAAKLGVTPKEVDKLCDAVLSALEREPLDPDGIKRATGKAVRNLGEEGKKKGLTTTLPLALGRLQVAGAIRRVPTDGRLDQQRYKYARWSPNPRAKSAPTGDEACAALARHFFRWVGPATMKEFQWFTGLGVKAAKGAVATIDLLPVEPGSDRLLLADDAKSFAKFAAPTEPHYKLVSCIDSIAAARRDAASLVDAKDRDKVAKITLGERSGGGLVDLAANAILDRGRLIGYWEFDFDVQQVVWATFSGKPDKELRAAVEETEAYVREQLGDARSFSLDSPKSRQPKLKALRALA